MAKIALMLLCAAFGLFGSNVDDARGPRLRTGGEVLACDCALVVQTNGAGVNLDCDGGCLVVADDCDFHTEWLNDGGIITTCACYPAPDAPYSCGGRDCESGFEWAPGVGMAFAPVGAVCWTVDCRVLGGCVVKAPPYVVMTNPCDC